MAEKQQVEWNDLTVEQKIESLKVDMVTLFKQDRTRLAKLEKHKHGPNGEMVLPFE